MKHLSAFVLDRYALGSLSAEERTEVEAHLESCAQCRAAEESAAALRRRFDEHVLPRTIARVTQLRRRRWWRWTPLVLAPALAVAALLLFVRPPREPEYGFKGGPMLTVYARHGDRVFVVRDGQTLQPGDELRFVVTSWAGRHYVLIASIDGAGQASIYHPFGGSRSAAIGEGRMELPGSVKLDETLGHERLYALFSQQPLDAAEVLRRLSHDGRFADDGSVATVQLAFEKQKLP
jgi:Putative zinc-finger